MADVHPQRHLRLLAVAAERALADQQPDDHPAVEVRERAHGPDVVAASERLFHRQEKRETPGARRRRAGVRPRRQSTSGATTSRRDGLLALAVRLDVVARLRDARARPCARARSSPRARPGGGRGRRPRRPGRPRRGARRPGARDSRRRRRRPASGRRSPETRSGRRDAGSRRSSARGGRSRARDPRRRTPRSRPSSSSRTSIGRLDAELDDELLQQFADALAQPHSRQSSNAIAYLRRPERFFFLRGGRGGGPSRCRSSTPTGAGSSALTRLRRSRAEAAALSAVAPGPFWWPSAYVADRPPAVGDGPNHHRDAAAPSSAGRRRRRRRPEASLRPRIAGRSSTCSS